MYSAITRNRFRSVLLLLGFFTLVMLVGTAYSLYTGQGYGPVIVAAVFAGVSGFVGYWTSDKVALMSSGAEPLPREAAPEVHRIIENLCLASGTQMPRIYVIRDESMNAFATGRNPKNAAIAVTTGLVNRLDRAELEGVIAHELSHIRNDDILVMTLAVVFAGTISMLGNLFFRMGGLTNRGRSNGNNGGGIFILIGLALLIVAPIAATLLRLAVSRQREYLADASAALLTRYPEGLAKALKKISGDPIIERASSSTAHLFIANPMQPGLMQRLFSTHPPITDRIARLQKMGAEA